MRVLVTFLTMMTSGFSVVECVWFAIAWTPKVRRREVPLHAFLRHRNCRDPGQRALVDKLRHGDSLVEGSSGLADAVCRGPSLIDCAFFDHRQQYKQRWVNCPWMRSKRPTQSGAPTGRSMCAGARMR